MFFIWTDECLSHAEETKWFFEFLVSRQMQIFHPLNNTGEDSEFLIPQRTLDRVQNFWSPKEHRKGFRISDPQRTLQRFQNFWSPKDHYKGSRIFDPQRAQEIIQYFKPPKNTGEDSKFLMSYKLHNCIGINAESTVQLAYLMWSKNLTSGHGNRSLTVITYTKRAFKNTTVHYRDGNSRLLFTCTLKFAVDTFQWVNVLYIFVYSVLQKSVVKKQRPWTEALPNKFLHRQSNFLSGLPVHLHFIWNKWCVKTIYQVVIPLLQRY